MEMEAGTEDLKELWSMQRDRLNRKIEKLISDNRELLERNRHLLRGILDTILTLNVFMTINNSTDFYDRKGD